MLARLLHTLRRSPCSLLGSKHIHLPKKMGKVPKNNLPLLPPTSSSCAALLELCLRDLFMRPKPDPVWEAERVYGWGPEVGKD